MFELLFALLFELFALLLALLAEFAIELAGAALLDLILRGIAEVFDTSQFQNPMLAALGYVFMGGTAGGFSLALFPHPLVHPSRIHGISLIISPAVTGLARWLVGSVLRKKGTQITRIASFSYAAVFAFGIALVRFLFAR